MCTGAFAPSKENTPARRMLSIRPFEPMSLPFPLALLLPFPISFPIALSLAFPNTCKFGDENDGDSGDTAKICGDALRRDDDDADADSGLPIRFDASAEA